MSEADLMRRLMKLLSATGARVFRNNTGQAWVGKVIGRPGGTMILQDPRPFHAGLCTGSSDLVGWMPIEIRQDHVGKTVAVFAAVEVKVRYGRLSADQERFLRAVHAGGGVAIVATCDDDASKLLSWDIGKPHDVDIDRHATRSRDDPKNNCS